MGAIITGLTREELRRFRKYTSLILDSNGNTDVLSCAEQYELKLLLEKSMLAQAVFTEAEIKTLYEIREVKMRRLLKCEV